VAHVHQNLDLPLDLIFFRTIEAYATPHLSELLVVGQWSAQLRSLEVFHVVRGTTQNNNATICPIAFVPLNSLVVLDMRATELMVLSTT
jgi:hypothetical protein